MGLVDNRAHRWPKPLQALEHKPYRLLWAATFVSNLGSWMQRVTIAWLVYTMSGSESWLGIESAVAGLPALVLLPYAGVLADRSNRRRVLIVGNLANALLTLTPALLWWSGMLNVWHLLLLSLLTGIVAAMTVPSSQSVVPAAAGDDHISNAVALNSLQYNLARAVGPALGGLVLASLGAGWCFVVNALTFLLMAHAARTLPDTAARDHRASTIRDSVSEAASLLKSRHDISVRLLFVALIAFGGAPIVTLLPAVSSSLSTGSNGYSALLACFGVGAVAAGILLTFAKVPNRLLLIVAAGIVVGLCEVAIVATQSLLVALVGTTIAGTAFVGAMIALGTELLAETPEEFRGRVSALQQLAFRTAQPAGALVAALLSSRFGLILVFTGFAVCLGVGSLTLSLISTERNRRSSDAAH